MLRRLRRAEDGVSAIEFALIATALFWLLLGVIDFGIMYWDQIQVTTAAQAGADYAAVNAGNIANALSPTLNPASTSSYASVPSPYATNIQHAVTGATTLSTISATSPTPAGCSSNPCAMCACPTASGGVGAAACSATCSSGGSAGTYIVVNASGTYNPIFPWFSSCPSSGQCTVTLTATSFVRIE